MKLIYRALPIVLGSLLMILAGCSNPPVSTVTTTSATATSTTTSSTAKLLQWNSPPPMTIDQNTTYTATLKTNYGDIVIQLFPKDAPLAVNNFVFLARQGYYNGVIFHRVVKNFVIQTGDPTGTGSGNPGYFFADETVTRNYALGTVAMANAGPNTNGSQFFICLADLSQTLTKSYTIFGTVTGGLDVVQKIGNVPTILNASKTEQSAPAVDVHINTVVVTEK